MFCCAAEAVGSFEKCLGELANLVHSEDFRSKQIAFFDKYSDEFDETAQAEENKLRYSTIHNEYRQKIEKSIEVYLGPKKLAFLLEEISNKAEGGVKLDKVSLDDRSAQAIGILESLGDYTAFKTTMMLMKQKKQAGETNDILQAIQKAHAVLSMDEAIQKAADVKTGFDPSDPSIEVLADEPNLSVQVKATPTTDYVRTVFPIPLPPKVVFEMIFNFSNPEATTWQQGFKKVDIARDFGPRDKVYMQYMDLPWAITYILGIPTEAACRIVFREDWPEKGCYGVVVAPYDLENEVTVESVGPIKASTKVIAPHPSDPESSMWMDLQTQEAGKPRWVIRMFSEQVWQAGMNAGVEPFKKSETYKRIMEANA